MILETDFLDHWKTRHFINMIGHEHATHYILRLWFHCQTRKSVYFEGMTAEILKAICRYDGDANNLLNAFIESGFLVGLPNGIHVPKWAEANPKMLANWDTGHKGGRPSAKQQKQPENAKPETQPKPNGNPNPIWGNPLVTGRKVGKDSKEEWKEGEDAPPTSFPDYETILGGLLENTKQAVIQAGHVYCMRRYRGTRFHETWYPNLLREIAGVFEVQENVEQALATFTEYCNRPPTPKLDRNASFSDICLAAGLKKPKPPPWQIQKESLKEQGRLKLASVIADMGKIND